MIEPRHRSRLIRLLALFAAAGLLFAACGDSGDDNKSSGSSGSGSSSSADEGTPKYGGKLVYGLEADTDSPWTPANMISAISCHMVSKAVYDPLTLVNSDGKVEGNLLESITSNADFTEWTLTPRKGITFHDGTPFNAAAIADNLTRQNKSFLTGQALHTATADGTVTAGVETITQVGETVVVKMKNSWSSFPFYLTGQIGYMASPKWLAAVDANKTLATKPVGTGPFVFQSYEVGGSFKATRNKNYWRTAKIGGKDYKLPFLDSIELRVLSSEQARKNALLKGDINIMHTSSGITIDSLKGNKDLKMSLNDEYGETNYIMLNVGNPDSEIADPRVRKALALATNNELLAHERGKDVEQVANGPFSPLQLGYLKDTGYPKFNLEEAKGLIADYKQDHPGKDVTIDFYTTDDPENLETNELIAQFWQQAGVKVNIKQIEQGKYIGYALSGDFEAFAWRNHGGVDPDGQRIWWSSDTALPLGKIALNFNRIKDQVIDTQFNKIRSTDDVDVRREAAETINRQFAKKIYNIWTTWTVWGIVRDPEVRGLKSYTLPSGNPDISSGIAGTHQVAQLWLANATGSAPSSN